jgi:hypothetical protein
MKNENMVWGCVTQMNWSLEDRVLNFKGGLVQATAEHAHFSVYDIVTSV